jgi:hypothetical protein
MFPASKLKMEAVFFSETVVSTYVCALRHNLEQRFSPVKSRKLLQVRKQSEIKLLIYDIHNQQYSRGDNTALFSN